MFWLSSFKTFSSVFRGFSGPGVFCYGVILKPLRSKLAKFCSSWFNYNPWCLFWECVLKFETGPLFRFIVVFVIRRPLRYLETTLTTRSCLLDSSLADDASSPLSSEALSSARVCLLGFCKSYVLLFFCFFDTVSSLVEKTWVFSVFLWLWMTSCSRMSASGILVGGFSPVIGTIFIACRIDCKSNKIKL